MKDIRMLMGYCPVYGRDLAQELLHSKQISFCYNASEYFCYEEENAKIINFNQTLGRNATYEKVYDLNKLPALSLEVMEKMLPYESMAIKLGMRKTGFPIVNYEDEKRNYHKHLRFWNYILDYYEINAVFFEEFPHISYTYVIYCLARIKNIPILMCNQTSMRGIRVWGHSIESAGYGIQDYYENVAKQMRVEDCILTGNVRDFFEKYSKPVEELKSEREKANFEKQELKRITKLFYGRFLGKNGFLKPSRKKASMISQVLRKKKDMAWYKRNYIDIRLLERECNAIRFYLKKEAMKSKEYNAMAEEPDYSQKYIYFGLQLTPEETTIPRAGVFSEQYTSVQLLARAAEKVGLYVYVKEHFVQAFRYRQDYELLKNIPNVRLIKTTISSFELMANSVAVATQTGTCILEGVLRGKPALVTSKGYLWKGMPGVFEIVEEEQGAEVLRKVLAGVEVNPDDVKRYFYSIQKKTFVCYMDADYMHQQNMPEHKASIKNWIALLQDFLSEIE